MILLGVAAASAPYAVRGTPWYSPNRPHAWTEASWAGRRLVGDDDGHRVELAPERLRQLRDRLVERRLERIDHLDHVHATWWRETARRCPILGGCQRHPDDRCRLHWARADPCPSSSCGSTRPGPARSGVRMVASGVCHSDLHVVDGDWARPTDVVLGHEGAGDRGGARGGRRRTSPSVTSWSWSGRRPAAPAQRVAGASRGCAPRPVAAAIAVMPTRSGCIGRMAARSVSTAVSAPMPRTRSSTRRPRSAVDRPHTPRRGRAPRLRRDHRASARCATRPGCGQGSRSWSSVSVASGSSAVMAAVGCRSRPGHRHRYPAGEAGAGSRRSGATHALDATETGDAPATRRGRSAAPAAAPTTCSRRSA